MPELLRRLHYLLHRRRFDDELVQEMEAHRAMVDRHGGRPFGDTLRLREEARDAWGWTWIDRLGQDLRYAARLLRRSPGFTATAVLTLSLGIGVNIAAFGFFNLVVLKPLPIPEPDRLLRFERRSLQGYAAVLPYPEMAFFRDHARTLSAVLALHTSKVTIDGEDKPANAHFVTANTFGELGGGVALGRALDPATDAAGDASPVAVLGHGFWQRHFGGDPRVVGQSVRLNGRLATIVGVASPEFSGLSLDTPDLWLPLGQQPYFVEGSRLLRDPSAEAGGVKMWGRLQPGLTAKGAEQELRLLARELREQYPKDIWENETLASEAGGYATSLTMGDRRGTGAPPTGELYPVLALIAALALLILVVACGNLGSLLLARGVAREREITIRLAVGAGRARVCRQLFTESLLLALLASLTGLALGFVVLRALMSVAETPAWLSPVPDWRVVLFAVGTGFGAALLFGLTPALQVARQRHRSTSVRQLLVGAQVAGSCVLLVVAGLLVRALDRAVSAHPGFEYEQVVSIDPALASHGMAPANAGAYLATLDARLRGLPGVESVTEATVAPLGRKSVVMGAPIGGRAVDVHMNGVGPQFLETMRIPILRGRNLQRGDVRTIVVSQSLALLQWPGEDPLGRPFPGGVDDAGNEVPFTVVGVAGNARTVARQNPDAVEAYTLATDVDFPSMVVLVKTVGPPEGIVPFMASVARGVDPKVLPEVQLLKTSFRRRVKDTEYSALAVSLLGLTALLLACLGIVGLVAFAVAQRTREIGIRMALGARSPQVLSVVLQQFARPVAAGLILGVGGAAALSQILRRQLYGVSSLDPIAYLAATGLFVVTVALAALWPARRALRVDPMLALRHE
jgi:putative ABC transport system permease protein